MNNSEYITQARKLLTEDYKTKHSNEYNNWLNRCKDSWMQPHVIVPFPPFVVSGTLTPFKPTVSAPSEEAVVAKALELYNQFNPAPIKNTETTAEPVAKPAPEILDELLAAPPADQVPAPVVKETPAEPVVEDPDWFFHVKEPDVDPLKNTVTIYKKNQELVSEEPPVEPVVDETIVEEPVVEQPVVEPLKNTVTIYKIFQEPVTNEPTSMPTTEPLHPTIEQALKVVPQPAEELAKVSKPGGIFPSVFEKLQDLKAKWITKDQPNV